MLGVYRCIGLDACNLGRRRFILNLFLEHRLVIEAFAWAKKNCKDGFEPECIAFILRRTYLKKTCVWWELVVTQACDFRSSRSRRWPLSNASNQFGSFYRFESGAKGGKNGDSIFEPSGHGQFCQEANGLYWVRFKLRHCAKFIYFTVDVKPWILFLSLTSTYLIQTWWKWEFQR